MNITEKAAYLKGLAEGLSLDPNSKEAKLFNAILDILDDISLIVSDLDEEVAVIADQLDAVDEDLDELEEFIYFGDEECDCCDDYDEEYFELECPNCHETIHFDESVFDDDDEVCCPACGVILDEIVLADEDDD